MDNHFHLLLQLPDPRQLSALAAGLLVAYWHHYRRRYGLVGHLFQNRFKSPAVEADTNLLTCGRYIERNPLEAGLVARPWDYPWSSARFYARGQSNALLAPNPWYEALAAERDRRQTLWREFLVGEDVKEEAVRRADWAVGSEAFLRRPSGQRGSSRWPPAWQAKENIDRTPCGQIRYVKRPYFSSAFAPHCAGNLCRLLSRPRRKPQTAAGNLGLPLGSWSPPAATSPLVGGRDCDRPRFGRQLRGHLPHSAHRVTRQPRAQTGRGGRGFALPFVVASGAIRGILKGQGGVGYGAK